MDTQLEQIVQRMIDAGKSEENIATVIQGYGSVTPEETPKADTGTIGPDKRNLLDKGLDAVSDLGPVPGVLVGAARNAIGNVAGLADWLMPDSVAKPIPFRSEPGNENERLGARAEQVGEMVGGLKGGAQVVSNIPGIVRGGAKPVGEFLKNNGAFVRDAAGRQGALGFAGRFAERIGEFLSPTSKNAGGTLTSPRIMADLEQAMSGSIDDAAAAGRTQRNNVIDETLAQGGPSNTTIRPTELPDPRGTARVVNGQADTATATTEFMRPVRSSPNVSTGRLNRTPEPAPELNNVLRESLEDVGRPESVEIGLSHPEGGGFTLDPRGGGRLATGSRSGDEMREALEEVRASREIDAPELSTAPDDMPLRAGATGRGELTAEDIARMERYEKYGLPDEQQKFLDAYRAMVARAEKEASDIAAAKGSKVADKAKAETAGKTTTEMAAGAKTNAASMADRVAEMLKGEVAPIPSHTGRVPMNRTGNEYHGIKPYSKDNALAPEEQAAAEEFWEQIALRGGGM